nr:NifB/NifX family molybdenum-iron cluster-binding protein [Ruminococcus albus]
MSQYRIAVATADGHKVDQHFGSASRFDIYRIEDNVSAKEKNCILWKSGRMQRRSQRCRSKT